MSSKIVLPNKHIFLTSANEVDQICHPLKKFGINHFVYTKSFKDGSHINLCNNAYWTDYFYNKQKYASAMFEGNQALYKSGYILWCTIPKQEVFYEAKSNFGIDHGITLIKKHHDCCEFFYFGSTLNNFMLINFYISNLDLLDRFILYFRNTAKKLIDKAVKQKLKTPQTQNELTRDLKAIYDEAIWQNEKRSQFVCETGVEKYFFENKTSELSLSKRDIDCILYLFQGKSANEISRKLYLSKRTVESRLDTLKMKLNCQGKSELIPKLLRMGLRFSCDREGRLFVTD